MQISDFQLNKFIDLYHKEFGVMLDKESAYAKGVQLLDLMKLTYKPITKENHEKYRKDTLLLLQKIITNP